MALQRLTRFDVLICHGQPALIRNLVTANMTRQMSERTRQCTHKNYENSDSFLIKTYCASEDTSYPVHVPCCRLIRPDSVTGQDCEHDTSGVRRDPTEWTRKKLINTSSVSFFEKISCANEHTSYLVHVQSSTFVRPDSAPINLLCLMAVEIWANRSRSLNLTGRDL